MRFEAPLQQVTLLRRYKRFLADVVDEQGNGFTVHCPNTGSMKHCVLDKPQRAFISDSQNPKRKYRHTLEAIQVAHEHWAGVNTGRANDLVYEAVLAGKVPGVSPANGVEREVAFADSRFDLALGERAHPHTFIEVKNVTLGPGPDDKDNGLILFPDAVTMRGQKHLQTLMQVVDEGKQAVLFFCVQHTGATAMSPADAIDKRYGELLREAHQKGVQLLAWRVAISSEEFVLEAPLPVVL